MTDPVYIHPAVQREADTIRAATDHTPTITRLTIDRWRITMDNGRVFMTVDYRLVSRSRLRWMGSVLKVDGKPRELAEDFDDFVRIFRDPDAAAHPRQGNAQASEPTPPSEAPPMPPTASVADAPTLVQEMHAKLTHSLPDAVATVGGAGSHWAIQLTVNSGTQMRINFRTRTRGNPGRRRPDFCAMDSLHPFTLTVDGVDRTAEIEGSIDKAIAFLAGTPGEQQQTTPPIHGPTQPPRQTNAVRVRQQTVMRI